MTIIQFGTNDLGLRNTVLPSFSEARLTELHSLVGGEESHEQRSLDDLDDANSVDIEVTPGLVEVGVHVLGKSLTGELLVGSEDLLSGGSGTSLVEPELARGLAVLTIGIAGLLLDGVVGDHGSHEDIIIVGGESSWDHSSVGLGTESSGIIWDEEVSTELDVGFVIGGG